MESISIGQQQIETTYDEINTILVVDVVGEVFYVSPVGINGIPDVFQSIDGIFVLDRPRVRIVGHKDHVRRYKNLAPCSFFLDARWQVTVGVMDAALKV